MDVPVAFKEGQGAWVPAAPADAWTAARGGRCSATRCSTAWRRRSRCPTRTSRRRRRLCAGPGAGRPAARRPVPHGRLSGSGPQRHALEPDHHQPAADGDHRRRRRATTSSSTSAPAGSPTCGAGCRAAVTGAQAGAAASQADLASARLAAQGELASTTSTCAAWTCSATCWPRTVEGYQRTATITNNRYTAGIVARTDVLQAQTQLANARADLLGIEQQRAQLEHAIAVLVGKAPANFSLPAQPGWQGAVPDVPQALPSTLLQRRPDIAAAERRVAQANEQIGIAQAGVLPQPAAHRLGGRGRFGDRRPVQRVVAGVGAGPVDGAEPLQRRPDARAGGGARAAFEAQAARYRQTVLTAFQDVEDQLVATRTDAGIDATRIPGVHRARDRTGRRRTRRAQPRRRRDARCVDRRAGRGLEGARLPAHRAGPVQHGARTCGLRSSDRPAGAHHGRQRRARIARAAGIDRTQRTG
jgi:hypothetical protein